MTRITVCIRPASKALREASAWYVAGSDPGGWLREICRWGVASDKIALFVLPQSKSDRSPAGVLVVTGSQRIESAQPRAVPYGMMGGRLWLPVDAVVHPLVAAEETDQIGGRGTMVWHPGIGLVGFDDGDRLRLWDLVAKPRVDETAWNRARDGGGLPLRLSAIRVPVMTKPEEEIFVEERKEFGTKPLSELPARPNEPGEGTIARVRRSVTRAVSKGIEKLVKMAPTGATKRTWINRLEDWAKGKANSVTRDLDDIHNKEILRLLAMLENDPENGLRHAIPMSGFPHRGISPDGDRLTERNPDFNLKNVQGGRPANVWSVAPELYAQLRKMYVEMANREISLGHFRRAAYIHGELLGDLDAAASVLKRGKHYREAGFLYRDRLNKPVEAASCFAEAGLIKDAAAIYEERRMFVELGDMYARVDNIEAAREAYKKAVAKELDAGHRVTAAQLTETKLKDAEKAWELLDDGCLHEYPSLDCMKAGLELSARHGRHDRAGRLLARARGRWMGQNIEPLVRVLLDVRRSYPDQAIRHDAADVVQIKIGLRLDEASSIEKHELVTLLASCTPEDRLLPRDGQRYLNMPDKPMTGVQKTPVKPDLGRVTLVRTIQLSVHARWEIIRSGHLDYFFAAARTDWGVCLVRGTWGGQQQGLTWEYDAPEFASMKHGRLVLAVGDLASTRNNTDRVIFLHGDDQSACQDQVFAAAYPHFECETVAGAPAWYPRDAIFRGRFTPCAISNDLLWLIRNQHGRVTIETWRLDGQITATYPVEHSQVARAEHMLVHAGSVAISAGDTLWYGPPGHLREFLFEGRIIGLTTAPRRSHPCLAVMLERGVQVRWEGQNQFWSVAEDMVNPQAVFTHNHDLVVQDATSLRIYRVDKLRVGDATRYDWKHGETVGLARTQQPNQFACLTKDGKIHVFEIPVS